ncbi:hypothetical protein [Saccharolobus solfataricus]|nr:hypothetical protein [Saccharolobus solfataricus]
MELNLNEIKVVDSDAHIVEKPAVVFHQIISFERYNISPFKKRLI